MRNVVAISIATFIIVCAGGYGILWYAQASSTKRAVVQYIDNLNRNQKYITYDAIETSGFPSNVFVSVVRPHFQGRIDELMKDYTAAMRPPVNPATPNAAPVPAPVPMQPWTEDLQLDGRITIGINALSDHYSTAVSGNWNEKSTINGQSTASLHQQLSDFTCVLQMQRDVSIFDTLWNFGSLNRTPDQLARDFRMLDCNIAGQQTTDAATRELLSSSGLTRLYITQTPIQGNSQLRFYVKLTDAMVTPAGDTRTEAYIHAMSPDYELPMKFSAYGKQNVDMDFVYNGPASLQGQAKNPPMDIAINKMDITNSVYDTHMTMHFNNAPASNTRTTALVFKAESNFSEQYDAMMLNMVRASIKRIYETQDPRFAHAETAIHKYSPDEIYGIVTPAVPSLHALGKFVTSVNGSFRGSDDFNEGTLTVDGLEISTTPYGFKGKGVLNIAQHLPSEENIVLSCSNCMQMLDDMAGYAQKLQKVASYFEPEQAQKMAVDPAQVNAVKQFLMMLAVQDPADKSVLSYTIAGAGPALSINGRSLQEVAQIYNEYVRPYFKAPAAGGSPAH